MIRPVAFAVILLWLGIASAEFPRLDHAVRVERVIDGDTFIGTVAVKDFGLELKHQRFRLAGIEAPERGEPGWRESGEHLARLLDRYAVEGYVLVRLERTRAGNPRRSFERYVARVYGYSAAGNVDIGSIMVHDGRAVLVTNKRIFWVL